jgi:uncharacterized protein YmfQ (DUF2313 family)
MTTAEDQTRRQVSYLPEGCAMDGKSIAQSVIYRFMKALAVEAKRIDDDIELFIEDIVPSDTEFYIDEWESAVGIPDECFSGTGTDADRRRDIVAKLASLGAQTAQDFEDIAAIFGIDVVVRAGWDVVTFPLTFPILFLDYPKFTIVVEYTVPDSNRFPLTFPIPFGTDELTFLECLFNKLKPANCVVLFRQI